MTTLAINILDVASGSKAEGVTIQVRKIVDGDWHQLPDAVTHASGQAILCEDTDLEDGGYFEALIFLGAYFDQTSRDLPQIKLVDIVPLRFGIEQGSGNISIHMSITPHSYNAGFSTQSNPLVLA